MSRSFRLPLARTFGSTGTPRLMTAIAMLIIVGLVYQQAKDARNWRWLAAQEVNPKAVAPVENRPGWQEVVIDAPHDGNPEELRYARMELGAVTDKEPLKTLDMTAYYRHLKWARAQSFEELEPRAKTDFVYAQLFQDPEKHRGQLVRLRLHVGKILRHDDVSENSSQATQLFELWGRTDESKSHPYCVVVPEIPNWFQVGGDNAREECVFVGYFIKLLAYDISGNKRRAAPMLVGRIRPLSTGPKAGAGNEMSAAEWGIGALIFGLIGVAAWRAMSLSRKPRSIRTSTASCADDVESWLVVPVSEDASAAVPVSVAPAAVAVAAAVGTLSVAASPSSGTIETP